MSLASVFKSAGVCARTASFLWPRQAHPPERWHVDKQLYKKYSGNYITFGPKHKNKNVMRKLSYASSNHRPFPSPSHAYIGYTRVSTRTAHNANVAKRKANRTTPRSLYHDGSPDLVELRPLPASTSLVAAAYVGIGGLGKGGPSLRLGNSDARGVAVSRSSSSSSSSS